MNFIFVVITFWGFFTPTTAEVCKDEFCPLDTPTVFYVLSGDEDWTPERTRKASVDADPVPVEVPAPAPAPVEVPADNDANQCDDLPPFVDRTWCNPEG